MKNFVDVEKSLVLAITAGKTPVIVGEKGIGKSAMMNEVADMLGMQLINIDCNLLKEGRPE